MAAGRLQRSWLSEKRHAQQRKEWCTELPDTIDWPRLTQQPPRKRHGLLVLIAIVAVFVFSFSTAVFYWVDLLWFRSLGYEEVFWRARGIEWAVFAAFAVVTFLVLYGAFSLFQRAHIDDLPTEHTLFVVGQQINVSLKPVLRVVSVGGSLLVAVLTGSAMAGTWQTFALWWYAPQAAGGVTDPIFGRSINFYLFTLPAWQLMAGWLTMLCVIACGIAALFLLVAGGSRALAQRPGGPALLPWRGLSISVASLLLVVALRVYLSRFELLFGHHTVFDGLTYTDAHVSLAGLLIVCAALVAGALAAAASSVFAPRGRWLAVAVAPAVICYLAVGLVSWYVSSFLVKPNQLDRERPYIAHNIEMTRQAYGLDSFERHEFPAETTVDAADRAQQSGHAPEYPPVGLACAAGCAAPDSGDSHLLRFSRHRHRPLYHQRLDARGDAGRARIESGQAPREQPQLDQRQADLHARLRHHHESGERIYAGGAARPAAQQYAGAKHGTGTQCHAAGDLLWRDDLTMCM